MSTMWERLRTVTQSRIGQDRIGDTVSSTEVLQFRAAHAMARDAVRQPLDVQSLLEGIEGLGLGPAAVVASRAASREEYLRRPDLGRRPADLTTVPEGLGADVGIVVADGLSTTAVAAHAVPMLAALREVFAGRLTLAPVVVATNARVALGDHVGDHLGVSTLLVLIGERPGLSVSDSLGIYLTHRPRPGRRDAERNCLSNIHPPEGLGYAAAARTVAALVDGARLLGESGVRLKDSSHQVTG
ncbi:ethanolamine ammonia-lyase subunit EutC [Aeromicrobium phragmitis]|uniref:Ethanolamine ammonia-lyase small subunit n=1 Tax=Aeromicrobium phragmitis TaxID=2478914 RepID=A0A3L8PHZ4_9ACTN|nr:ethanolamine ammonia-lyase subunit EutC [Aeromicrobium phragmitis]RLV54774.1 ethanolamine ammonia-lyase subunit EutC [Aeromicrobium phragmitis]